MQEIQNNNSEHDQEDGCGGATKEYQEYQLGAIVEPVPSTFTKEELRVACYLAASSGRANRVHFLLEEVNRHFGGILPPYREIHDSMMAEGVLVILANGDLSPTEPYVKEGLFRFATGIEVSHGTDCECRETYISLKGIVWLFRKYGVEL